MLENSTKLIVKISERYAESDKADIRQKSAERYTARMMAGFCWPWSGPRPDGTLLDDVIIGDYARPWNAKSDAGRLAPGIPKESLSAYDPAGLDQVGCVYTAQDVANFGWRAT